jgi:hypothetical protein
MTGPTLVSCGAFGQLSSGANLYTAAFLDRQYGTGQVQQTWRVQARRCAADGCVRGDHLAGLA